MNRPLVTNAAAPRRPGPFFGPFAQVRISHLRRGVAQSSGAFLAIRRKTTLETTLQNRRNFFLVLAFGAASLLGSIASASAEGLFEALFGRWTGPSAYADPQPQFNPFAGMRSEGAGSVAYCVRVCDGRYFPIQRHGGISPAQACSSFCPASETRIYNGGSSIDHAVSGDGRRYTELNTAFVYRQKIVPGCTCNGRDAFGLVITPVAEDTTLRPGDIVATNRGLMAYNGSTDPRAPNFTPVNSYAGLSAELRQRLTETKITPGTDIPAPPPATKQAEITARNTRGKRAQADR